MSLRSDVASGEQRWRYCQVPDYRHQTPREPEPKTEHLTLQQTTDQYLADLNSGERQLIELGIADLDYAIGGGAAPGEMVIIAARPSHGKSAVALQCLDTTSRDGLAGVMISEEMSTRAIGKRTIQFVSDEPEERWRAQGKAVRSSLDYHFARREPVYVVEGCRTAKRASETIEWYVKEKGVKCAVVDYAQLLSSRGKSRYEQITETSIALRSVANTTGILLIVLCQLSRSVESRDSFTPKMSDLKDSGQLEQDADVVIFLVWPHRIDSKNDPHVYQMFVGKNRNRPINSAAFEARFMPSRQMVLPPSVKEEPNYVNAFDEWNESD